MAFLVSPGVEVKEIDLTNIVPAVSTSIGAYSGHFNWGPVGDIVNLGNEKELARYFGVPSKSMAQSYFTASTFLRYGNALLISRAINDDRPLDEAERDADTGPYGAKKFALNASSGQWNPVQNEADLSTLALGPFLIRNIDEYQKSISETRLQANFYARCPGEYGNSLKVMIQPAGVQTRFNVTKLEVIGGLSTERGGKSIKITITDNDDLLEVGSHVSFRAIRSRQDWVNRLETTSNGFYLGDRVIIGGGVYTYRLYTDSETLSVYDPDASFPVNYLGDLTPTTSDSGFGSQVNIPNLSQGFLFSPPETEDFETAFITSPGTSLYAQELGAVNDEIHVLVIDVDGVFSASPGTVLERYDNLSIAIDAKNEDGSTNYYRDVINTSSNYIIVDNLNGIMDGAGENILESLQSGIGVPLFTNGIDSGSIFQIQLQGGANGERTNGNIYQALEIFEDPELIDVNLLFAENDSKDNIMIANKLISISERRKDCVCFISPDIEVALLGNDDAKLDRVIRKFDRLPSSNYAVFDSTPLYIYDKYNDEYIWVPASGSIAGLCARTDDVRDPWWSPAGYNRGQLLGVAKLAYNPLQNHRDELYKARVNPIVAFPGEGIILFGDKTAQAKPSAFDRINVRRLFIVLEKAIATAAKYSLFEFNDEFTRAQFRNLVEPYLRDIQGRRGITDFLVVCDQTNNTGEVIDSNRFVADIYIKPARSINFITLNFIATRTGVEFDEVVGKF
jgi:hypothetical protein